MLGILSRKGKFNKQRFNQIKRYVLNYTRDYKHTRILDVGSETIREAIDKFIEKKSKNE